MRELTTPETILLVLAIAGAAMAVIGVCYSAVYLERIHKLLEGKHKP